MPELLVRETATGVVDILGPGQRSVVWVQGCTIHCPGCIVPESWSQRSGDVVKVSELAETLLVRQPSAHLTVSGGEPTEQPEGVAHLLSAARQMGRTTWVYTGRRLEDLLVEGDEWVLRMLAATDVLVDGAFDATLAASVPYRGSSNQRILRLTNAIPFDQCQADGLGGRVELTLGAKGDIRLVGIPPPGFLRLLKEGLAAKGIQLDPEGSWV